MAQPEKGWVKILDSATIANAVKSLAGVLNTRFAGKSVVVVCILKGAVYFHVDLVRQLTMPCSEYFIEATSYHNNQTGGKLNIMSSINPEKFVGREVILIDELFDKGHTLTEIREALHIKAAIPYERITTCTLFRKETALGEGCRSPDFYGIRVPDVWLVGYGLDDRQEKRGLTDLWACPKAPGIPKSVDDARIFP